MQPVQTIEIERHDRVIAIHPAASEDDWAVRSLFGALHTYNATLESRFALATGWQQLLDEQLARERATGDGRALLAWAGAEPVGLAMIARNPGAPLFRHGGWAELTALYVMPSIRGAGIGGELLQAALRWTRKKGFAELRLYVTASNNRARRFYAAAGLHPIQEIWMTEVNPEFAASDASSMRHPVRAFVTGSAAAGPPG